mmetsp:Transcript_23304/g.34206  ORF Transcript_23304/g.34206 Transcript_23304/m.34206 type:complete len:371 (+) Transcript_23304:148-1260(+)|eukprot:CAMPEP_0185017540 /NCGR_PEP_ID=MMETSP1103-20130426/478_1 /TAXON_ID=36769 /ORGANISM="Paraphysomonas bandaiensis, Strain Caron Lab Isolate" /LENGTH=370 /DNA_ID=CAMNT_0027546997 /DNA_START=131 /DNA_END=1243 /DNA_ORIENTATION=+
MGNAGSKEVISTNRRVMAADSDQVSADRCSRGSHQKISTPKEGSARSSFDESNSISAEINCVRSILASESGRLAFISYIVHYALDEEVPFFDTLRAYISNKSDNIAAGVITNSYYAPGVINFTEADCHVHASSSQPRDTFAMGMKMTVFDCVNLLFWRECDRFMKSDFYAKIPEEDRSAVNLDPKVDLHIRHKVIQSDTAMIRAVVAMRPNKLHLYTTLDNWIGRFFQSLENLPFSVSVATARTDRPGFPLVYVNKQYETETGYNRHNITGINSRFLQCPHTEQDSVEKMREALRAAQPIRVVVTNRWRTGETFLNYVSMKPVFDQNARYRFVVAASYPSNSRVANCHELQLINDFLDLVPSTVLSGVDI